MKDIGEGNLLDAMKGAFQLKDNIAPYGDELDDHINIILGAAHAGVQKSKQR